VLHQDGAIEIYSDPAGLVSGIAASMLVREAQT